MTSKKRPWSAQAAITLGLATLAATLLAAPSAGAGIPKRDYACYGEANIYIATLEVKSAKKYRYLGKGGKYRAKGKVVVFKKGPLKKWVGRKYRASGDPAIRLVTDQRGGQTVRCYG